MFQFNKTLILVILVLIGNILTSCVSSKAQYKSNWQKQPEVQDPYYSVYLIGDAGDVTFESDTKVFDYLTKELENESENSAIIWLGDNIYPIGLAPQNSVYYDEGKYRLLAQLKTMSNFKGQKYFIPGNHDWYAYGRVGLRRQEILVDSFLQHTPNPSGQLNFFLPDKGCSDPQVVNLKEDIGLLLMDSHWYLNNKSEEGGYSICEVKTGDEFINRLTEEIEINRDKSLIIASHHPPYTYAHHGGKFTMKDDVFPLTQVVNWLYLPLPLSGIIFNRARLRLSDQDVYHPVYKRFRSRLISALQSKGRSIVASGHEHALQFIENNNQYFVVSGAGSKSNKVGMGKGSKFSIGEKGFVKLVFLDSKKVVIQFVVPGQFIDSDNIAYETIVTLQ